MASKVAVWTAACHMQASFLPCQGLMTPAQPSRPPRYLGAKFHPRHSWVTAIIGARPEQRLPTLFISGGSPSCCLLLRISFLLDKIILSPVIIGVRLRFSESRKFLDFLGCFSQLRSSSVNNLSYSKIISLKTIRIKRKQKFSNLFNFACF